MEPPSIKRRLIEALSGSRGVFLSGQSLADMLGCSRTAVWKHIDDLRKEGFQIEAVRKKGYKIIKTPDQISENEILFGLGTERIGRNIVFYETVDSTQRLAHEMAHNGATEGTIVIADEQTGGRGRMSRQWHSPRQQGIWMSMILRPNLPPQKAPQFTLIAAVAAVQAIEEVAGLNPEIKWPNDILIQGKKMTGILTELQADPDHIHFLIIGMGMNVNQHQEDFPPEVKDAATSLSIEKGEPISRVLLIRSYLEHFEKYYDIYMEKGFGPLKLLWESYAVSIGKNIIARTLSGEIAGRAIGITEDGVLRIQDKYGQIHEVYSADIEIKP